MSHDKSGMAFPAPDFMELTESKCGAFAGLTKREWFTGMALQGLLAAKGGDGTVMLNGQKLGIDEASIRIANSVIAGLKVIK